MAKGFMKNGVFHPIDNDSEQGVSSEQVESHSESEVNQDEVEKLKHRNN